MLVKGINNKTTPVDVTDVSRTTQDDMRKHLDDIKLLDLDTEVKYRGGLAGGSIHRQVHQIYLRVGNNV